MISHFPYPHTPGAAYPQTSEKLVCHTSKHTGRSHTGSRSRRLAPPRSLRPPFRSPLVASDVDGGEAVDAAVKLLKARGRLHVDSE